MVGIGQVVRLHDMFQPETTLRIGKGFPAQAIIWSDAAKFDCLLAGITGLEQVCSSPESVMAFSLYGFNRFFFATQQKQQAS